LRLLAVRLSTSCVSNVLAGKLQKQDIFASCGGLRVLAAQELLVPLLARALFLGCTVCSPGCFLWCEVSFSKSILYCELKAIETDKQDVWYNPPQIISHHIHILTYFIATPYKGFSVTSHHPRIKR